MISTLRGFLITIVAFSGISTYASIDSNSVSGSSPRLENIFSAQGDRKAELMRRQGPALYRNLRTLAFDKDKTLGLRWQAFMTLTEMGKKQSLPEIRLALKSPDWFMRDAALKVLPQIDSRVAYESSIAKLHDSSLVVRTTAVDALGEVNDAQCTGALWLALNRRENFMHDKSLWIRKHIVRVLSELENPRSQRKFVALLDDKDPEIQELAIGALEHLTGKVLGKPDSSVAERKGYWKQWSHNGQIL